jgi:hypothetical protein
MKSVTKTAGAAAIALAFCYLFGFAMLTTVMNPGDTTDWTEIQKLAFVLERSALFHLWHIVIYVLFGIALVTLASLLHRLLETPESALMAVATPFAFIWAGLVIASGMLASVGLSAVSEIYPRSAGEAVQLWLAIGTVQNGLGGGVEIVGGVWILLLSASALRSRRLLPVALNWIGVAVGIAGIATIVPALSRLGAVFGLVQIVWFSGIGAVLLRAAPHGSRQASPADSADDGLP